MNDATTTAAATTHTSTTTTIKTWSRSTWLSPVCFSTWSSSSSSTAKEVPDLVGAYRTSPCPGGFLGRAGLLVEHALLRPS